MGVPWAPLAAGAGSFISGMMQGDKGGPVPGFLNVVNPVQALLAQGLQMRALAGDVGDTGYGALMKGGKGQLQQQMARFGTSPKSGVYQGAYANMLASANAMDAQNRWSRIMGLASMGNPYIMGAPSNQENLRLQRTTGGRSRDEMVGRSPGQKLAPRSVVSAFGSARGTRPAPRLGLGSRSQRRGY